MLFADVAILRVLMSLEEDIEIQGVGRKSRVWKLYGARKMALYSFLRVLENAKTGIQKEMMCLEKLISELSYSYIVLLRKAKHSET